MKHIGAIAILTTMFLGLFAWAGSSIIDLKTKASKIEAENKSTKELLREVRDDVKSILRALPRE